MSLKMMPNHTARTHRSWAGGHAIEFGCVNKKRILLQFYIQSVVFSVPSLMVRVLGSTPSPTSRCLAFSLVYALSLLATTETPSTLESSRPLLWRIG